MKSLLKSKAMKFSHLFLGIVVLICTSCNSESSNEGETKASTSESSNEDSDASTTNEGETKASTTVGDLGIPDGNYSLTKDKPRINWTAKKITGSGHSGIIPATNGKFKVEAGIITKGLVTFNMNGFEATDIIDGDSKEDFDSHLKNEDFFDVDKFPEATLTFNSSSINKEGKKILSCTLDMHGIAVDYDIPFKLKEQKLPEGGMGYNISAEFFMDRTKHELIYGSGSVFDNLGDKAIQDEVLISFEFLAL
jgi:polyisoprenoid-binding protein YceI